MIKRMLIPRIIVTDYIWRWFSSLYVFFQTFCAPSSGMNQMMTGSISATCFEFLISALGRSVPRVPRLALFQRSWCAGPARYDDRLLLLLWQFVERSPLSSFLEPSATLDDDLLTSSNVLLKFTSASSRRQNGTVIFGRFYVWLIHPATRNTKLKAESLCTRPASKNSSHSYAVSASLK